MTDMTVSFPEERLTKLRPSSGNWPLRTVSLQKSSCVRASKILAEEEFKKAAEYVLNKNKELYQWLASCNI